MQPFNQVEESRALIWIVLFHIAIIAASNFFVQIPLNFFGLNSTWGTFTFPFIFLATDLTVRIFGAKMARKIIFFAMIPALILSYSVSVLFVDGAWMGLAALTEFNLFVARIALASFSAYVIGQLMDIFVFNKIRQNRAWWVAPAAAGIFGNMVDTIAFFTIAFYKTSDPYLSENLLEIALIDYAFKMAVSLLLFVPLYGVILKQIVARITKKPSIL